MIKPIEAMTAEELLAEFGPDRITDYGKKLRAEILRRMEAGRKAQVSAHELARAMFEVAFVRIASERGLPHEPRDIETAWAADAWERRQHFLWATDALTALAKPANASITEGK